MDRIKELSTFYKELSQEIYNKSILDETEDFRENTFTQIFIDYLCEAAEIESGDICFYESRGIKINAYSIPEDETTLVLIASIFKNKGELFSIPPTEVLTMFNRLKQFYDKSTNAFHLNLEEAYAAFDIAKYIYDTKDKISTVKLIVFTNGTVKSTSLPIEEENGVTFVKAIWDLERLYRVTTSGNKRDEIEIDLKKLVGEGIKCIKTVIPEVVEKKDSNKEIVSGGYISYLTVLSGQLLFKIYEAYNARLLEKNVRAFLQARGGVNKGIKKTIQMNPEMFLAYNNGISATAESVVVENETDNYCEIIKLNNFQIVNGGQTTASIFNTCLKDNTPLDRIFVQAKITVVNDLERMDLIVPEISLYANTQNKVQMADFSANDEFHQSIEALSRTVWAPASTGGEQQTKWFYERARGQYADTRSREKNTKYFDSIYPKKQYFDKIQLARYENVWDQLPYITSRGGQASFRDFTIRLKGRGRFIPNQEYYCSLIAKAILYKKIREIVKEQDFLGYWVNITDYTVAYISYKTGQRIDLQKIWKEQNISENIKKYASLVANQVYNFLLKSSAGKNTQQWCKQEECWKEMKKLNIDFDEEVTSDLIDVSNKTTTAITQNMMVASDEEKKIINAIKEIDSGLWYAVAKWGKETGNLATFQIGIANTLGRYYGWKKDPSRKQAMQGIKILRIAFEKGFINEPIVKDIMKMMEE